MPRPQDKVLNSKGNRKPVVWLGWLGVNPYLYLYLNTRTWFPITETRDLKMDSRSARSADPTSRQLKVAGTCHPLSDLAKMIGERNHLANGRDAVAPYLKTKY